MSKLVVLLCFLISVTYQPKTLIVGDSISLYKNGWQDMLCKNKNLNCTNIAKGSKQTNWMLSTLKLHLEKDHSYTQVLIYGGINDVFSYTPVDSAVKNIQRMIDVCKLYDIKPIIVIGYNPNTIIQNSWIKNKEEEALLRNRYITYQKRLLKIKNVKIIPMVPTQTIDTVDGIHLNNNGHKRFYNWFINYF